MSSMFRAGHNKPKPRLREPLRLAPESSTISRRTPVFAVVAFALLLAAGWAFQAKADPASIAHDEVIESPATAVRNN